MKDETNNVVRLNGARELREQAAGWIVGVEEGLTDQQMSELKAWLAADAAHRKAFLEMAEQWDAFDSLAELKEILPLRAEPARTNRLAFAGAAIAAVAVCAIGAALYFSSTESMPTPRAATPAPLSLVTAVGEHSTSTMPDGSTLSLNTNTALTVTFSNDERLVVLERGEASFQVAHDKSRPFRVRAGNRVVQAVGTVFNVRRDDSGADVQVTVTEGVVKILNRNASPTDDEVFVRAGQLADIGEAKPRVQRIEPARLDASQAWQRGLLIYQGQTLEDVIADVSRYTPVHFRIEDDSIRQRRVGGVFRAGDVDGLLLALRETFGIEPRRDGDVIVLSARE